MEKILTEISALIWDKYLMVALLGVGVYYTVATRFVQVRYLPAAFKQMLDGIRHRERTEGGEGTLTSFQALTNALASCVGNGNIVAVSYTHLTLPTKYNSCRSRWSPYH